MKYICTFLLPFLLLACDKSIVTGNPEQIKPTQDIKDFSVTLNFVSAEKIKEKCDSLGTPYTANGCNAFHIPQNHCDIYVVEPKNMNDLSRFEVMGHELLHCRYGAYHQF